ncbi:FadR/GntR family transcriptional regulator [Dactylosporangium siamense]|uniref:GntR family transcriptional regulator n=1 Tax=Dactylosporangium siamense TaxID=685454 RepID=A0A919PRG2_9ACTN|nr:FadR/GntR family transcriptional regulator [Dactylosporangium siamense]GIG47048.1 GntR family transcriptional regulator [Dactylosporangium siamense]
MALSDDAVGGIKAMILDGRLRAGDRLPVEKDLAAELGLSRGTLREAVRALTLIGVLDTRQGDGTYVTSLEPHQLLGSLSITMDLHQDSAELFLLETRRALESHATSQAAVRIQPAELAELGQILDAAEHLLVAADVDHDALLEHDQAFHRLIVRVAGNPVLASLTESLSGQTMRARLWRELADEGAARRTLGEHRAILAALTARDPELARIRAAVHVAGVEDFVRSQMASGRTAHPVVPTTGATGRRRARG